MASQGVPANIDRGRGHDPAMNFEQRLIEREPLQKLKIPLSEATLLDPSSCKRSSVSALSVHEHQGYCPCRSSLGKTVPSLRVIVSPGAGCARPTPRTSESHRSRGPSPGHHPGLVPEREAMACGIFRPWSDTGRPEARTVVSDCDSGQLGPASRLGQTLDRGDRSSPEIANCRIADSQILMKAELRIFAICNLAICDL